MSIPEAAIIGAGPIGIELAVAFKRAGISYLHFDACQIGYTISWFPPQTRFFSSNDRIAIAGVPLQTPDQNKSTREQYLAYLRSIVQMFDLRINTYELVSAIHRNPDGAFRIETSPQRGRQEYHARRIILATGGTTRPRSLNIPGENLPHVSHYCGDPHQYFRTRLLVVGGKNSAIEAALRCHHAGAQVSLSYRREQLDPKHIKYWLMPEMNGLIQSTDIRAEFRTQPIAITPSHVTLKRDDQTIDIPADFVLLMTGYEADMTLCKMAGIDLIGECQTPAHNPATMESNVPGIYVAGTVVGGTQDKYTLFIENCHVHTDRILAAITHKPAPITAPIYDRPES